MVPPAAAAAFAPAALATARPAARAPSGCRWRRAGSGAALALAAVAAAGGTWPGVARAGVAFRCTGADGSITLTDQPCGRGVQSKTYKTLDALALPPDGPVGAPRRRRASGDGGGGSDAAPVGAPPSARPVATTAAAAAGLLPGVRPVSGGAVSNRGNQKVAICAALAEERSLAQKQMRGEAVPQAGENPRDNLALIERQWSRVGCAGVGATG